MRASAHVRVTPSNPALAGNHANLASTANVVQLHPGANSPTAGFAPTPSGAASPVEMPGVSFGPASTTAAARERRRHVLMALTGLAFATLLAALFARGAFVAVHIAADVLLVGYVILLVRYRQIAMDRVEKVEPIRPPVTEQAPASLQLAPSYLLRSGT